MKNLYKTLTIAYVAIFLFLLLVFLVGEFIPNYTSWIVTFYVAWGTGMLVKGICDIVKQFRNEKI
jgi:hypothetical protein